MTTSSSGKTFLTPENLCDRYSNRVNVKTLANWRSQGTGPPFTKIGGAVMYELAHVEKWEEANTVNTIVDEKSGS